MTRKSVGRSKLGGGEISKPGKKKKTQHFGSVKSSKRDRRKASGKSKGKKRDPKEPKELGVGSLSKNLLFTCKELGSARGSEQGTQVSSTAKSRKGRCRKTGYLGDGWYGIRTTKEGMQ